MASNLSSDRFSVNYSLLGPFLIDKCWSLRFYLSADFAVALPFTMWLVVLFIGRTYSGFLYLKVADNDCLLNQPDHYLSSHFFGNAKETSEIGWYCFLECSAEFILWFDFQDFRPFVNFEALSFYSQCRGREPSGCSFCPSA